MKHVLTNLGFMVLDTLFMKESLPMKAICSFTAQCQARKLTGTVFIHLTHVLLELKSTMTDCFSLPEHRTLGKFDYGLDQCHQHERHRKNVSKLGYRNWGVFSCILAEINRIQLLRGCFIYTVYKLLKLLHKMIHCKALLCSVAYYIFCHKLFNVYLMFSVYNDQPCSILCKNKKNKWCSNHFWSGQPSLYKVTDVRTYYHILPFIEAYKIHFAHSCI